MQHKVLGKLFFRFLENIGFCGVGEEVLVAAEQLILARARADGALLASVAWLTGLLHLPKRGHVLHQPCCLRRLPAKTPLLPSWQLFERSGRGACTSLNGTVEDVCKIQKAPDAEPAGVCCNANRMKRQRCPGRLGMTIE
jgi:hypothetical protein